MITSLKKHIFIIFITLSFVISAQEKPVRLIEEKQKKRTILFVQNDTDDEKSVFLKVNPTGYRRSAQRPIIRKIPAKSKVQMLILIPLTDVESHYTYNLIINDELETIDVKRSKELKRKDSL